MEKDGAVAVAETSAAEKKNQESFTSGVLTRDIERAWFDKKEVPLPKTTEKTAAPDTSKETASEPDGKSATATETVKEGKQENSRPPRKPAAEDRIGELTGQVKAKDAELEQLRAKLKDLEGTKTSTTADTSTARTQAPAEPELKEPVMPEMKDFEGKPWSEYQAAIAKYSKDMAEYSAKKAVAEDRQRQANEVRGKIVQAAMAEAQKAYPDWNDVGKVAMTAIYGDGKPESGAHPAVKHAIGLNPAEMPHLLYVLGGDKGLADFVALSRRDPVAAIMELGVKRVLLSQELAKAGKEIADLGRNDKGQFTKGENKDDKESPATTETKEPNLKETRTVGTRGSGPEDVQADAVRRNDFRTFDREQTRKAAIRKGLIK